MGGCFKLGVAIVFAFTGLSFIRLVVPSRGGGTYRTLQIVFRWVDDWRRTGAIGRIVMVVNVVVVVGVLAVVLGVVGCSASRLFGFETFLHHLIF